MAIKKFLFLPDYVVNGCKAKGKSFTNLTNDIDNLILNKQLVNTNPEITFEDSDIIKYFTNLVSRYDVKDIIAANSICCDQLYIDNTLALIYTSQYDANNILDIYTTDDKYEVSLENIIMSSKVNKDIELPFALKVSESTIFILLQNGFFNFISYNVRDFIKFFLNILITFYFKVGGDKQALMQSTMFSRFLSLLDKE